MKTGDRNYQSIWLDEDDPSIVRIIDQEKLPFYFETMALRSVDDVYFAIEEMKLRGAPLIGAAGAFGIYLATLEITSMTDIRDHLTNAARYLKSCRPTAVNLAWAINKVMGSLDFHKPAKTVSENALTAALMICETEKENCRQIGIHGLELIEKISREKEGAPVNILDPEGEIITEPPPMVCEKAPKLKFLIKDTDTGLGGIS